MRCRRFFFLSLPSLTFFAFQNFYRWLNKQLKPYSSGLIFFVRLSNTPCANGCSSHVFRAVFLICSMIAFYCILCDKSDFGKDATLLIYMLLSAHTENTRRLDLVGHWHHKRPTFIKVGWISRQNHNDNLWNDHFIRNEIKKKNAQIHIISLS